MSLFPKDLINSVRQELDAQVVLQKIDYRPEMIQDNGSIIKAFCPIHRETIFRTLLVEKDPGTYRCSNYGCAGNIGGDLIDLYAKALNMSYEQAMMELAAHFGLNIDFSIADQYVGNALEVARNYVELGVLPEAEENFQRVLRFKPDHQQALEGLLDVYEKMQHPDQAASLRMKIAKMHLAQEGGHAQAILHLKAYVESRPHDFEARRLLIDCLKNSGQIDWAAGEYVNLADDLASRGEIDQALTVYRQAEQLETDAVDVSMHIYQLLVDAGRTEEAIGECLKQADRRMDAHDYEGAFKALDAALELDGRSELVVRQAEVAACLTSGGDALETVVERIQQLIAARDHGPAGRALDAIADSFGARPSLIALRAELEESRGNSDSALGMRLQAIDEYQQRREFDLALGVLNKAIHDKTDNVALLSRKANILRDLNRIGDAVEVYLNISDLFDAAEEYEHAAAVYQTVIDLQPDIIDHREAQLRYYFKQGMEPIIVQKSLALAEAWTGRGEIERAIGVLGTALEAAPDSPELLARHGELLVKEGRKAEAAEQFMAVGRVYLSQELWDRAREVLNHALKCVPEHLEAREALADVQAAQEMHLQAMGVYSDLAEFFLRENDSEAAVRIARKVLTIQPEHMPTLLLLSKAYGMAGEVDKELSTQTRLVQLFLQGQSYTRASDLCEEILSQHPDYTPALEQLVAISEATKHTSQSVKYLWSLAQIHARSQRREQEQGILEQILQKDPLHEAAWFRHLELRIQLATPRALRDSVMLLVQHFEGAGRSTDAVQILEDLAHAGSAKPELFAGLATLYRINGDTDALKNALRHQAELLGKMLRDDEALEVWESLSDLQPADTSVLRTRIEIMHRNEMYADLSREYQRLARLLIQRGRYEEAEMALGEVLNLDPRNTSARDTLITIHINTKDFKRAAELIEDSAGRFLEEGKPRDAIGVLERVFEFDRKREKTYRKIIGIHQRLGDTDAILATYTRLLGVLEEQNDVPAFEQAAGEAIEHSPSDWALRHRLADFLIANDKPDDSERVLLAMAGRQLELGLDTEAESTLERLLELNPDCVKARAQRAELLAKRGQIDDALSEFRNLAGAFSSAAGASGAARGGFGGNGSGQSREKRPFQHSHYEGIPLNPEYTFENFIVGGRNNFAHATAMAVAKAPARDYNPLFLYSDVGLGKTHLCHAIAHQIREHHPEFKIFYTPTEEFVAQLIEAIQNNSISSFRNLHKMPDVLIVDDVQFLSGKERAQEEFFNVFNAIYQAGRQVMLTSDRPPKDISHLEKRLKSRFGAGIIVDIQPPDLETRIAILRGELHSRDKDGALTDEVLLFIAEHIESNVRDLKGALNQVLARHDFSGEMVDIVLTKQILEANYSQA